MKKRFDLVVVGELNLDLIVRGLDSLPALGTEKIATEFETVLGGSAAILACGASRLGLSVGFIGKVGDDDYGNFIIHDLKKYHVDTAAIIIDSRIKTGITISLTFPEDRAFVTYLGSIAALRFDEISADYVKQARHMHFSALFLNRGLQKDVPSLFKLAKISSMTTSLDPGFDPEEKWDSGIFEILRYTDIFLPNEVEAMKISQKSNIEKALDFLSQYSKMLAVKLGSKGSIGLDEKKKKIYSKGFKVQSMDTTGSGDSFNAGFLYGFLHGHDLGKSMELGNVCGAISTTKIGGANSCPNLKEALDFLDLHKNR